jgi:hypothetical protein
LRRLERERERLPSRLARERKLNSTRCSLSLASPRHFRVAFTFSLSRALGESSVPRRTGGFAAPSGGRLPDRPLRCSASSAPRRFFAWQRPGRCATWPGAVRARVCVRECLCAAALCAFRRCHFPPLSLKAHVQLCGSLFLSLNAHVLYSLSLSLSLTLLQSTNNN